MTKRKSTKDEVKDADWLLSKAKGFDSPDLKEGIEAVEALGDDEDIETSEAYQSLLDKVNEILVHGKSPDKVTQPDKDVVLSYAGIKMIGNLYYSVRDGYKSGYADAEECARVHNG